MTTLIFSRILRALVHIRSIHKILVAEHFKFLIMFQSYIFANFETNYVQLAGDLTQLFNDFCGRSQNIFECNKLVFNVQAFYSACLVRLI